MSLSTLATLHAAFGNAPFTATQALASTPPDALPEKVRWTIELHSYDPRTDPVRSYGKWFSAHKGRTVDGYRVSAGRKNRLHQTLWSITRE